MKSSIPGRAADTHQSRQTGTSRCGRLWGRGVGASGGGPTCVDVAHACLLEQGVDLQHLLVGRLGLQLLHLRCRGIKLRLRTRSGVAA